MNKAYDIEFFKAITFVGFKRQNDPERAAVNKKFQEIHREKHEAFCKEYVGFEKRLKDDILKFVRKQ